MPYCVEYVDQTKIPELSNQLEISYLVEAETSFENMDEEEVCKQRGLFQILYYISLR